jgi:hypothetical protein
MNATKTTERDRLLGLLADVAENSSAPAGGNWALVPAGLLAEIRQTVDQAVTPCPDCGESFYVGIGCGLCALDSLPGSEG